MASIEGKSAPAEQTPRKDKRLGLYFGVELGGIQVALFSECSGLSVETEVFEYTEGGLNTHTYKLPVRTKYANITLKRGMDAGGDLYTWYMSTLDGKTQRKNVTITLYDSQQNSLQSWSLLGAYPVKWTGPDFKADAGAVAVETVELAHHGFNLQADANTVTRTNDYKT